MLACEESASIVCARVMRGHELDRERADAARGQRLADLGPLERAEVRDQERRRGRSAISSSLGGATRRTTSAAASVARRVRRELGAGERVALVGKAGRGARAALDADARTLRDQARGLVGGERDASLAVCALAADGDEHSAGRRRCLLVGDRHAAPSGSMCG